MIELPEQMKQRKVLDIGGGRASRMETRVFTRCSGGCFFATDYCPVDGWTSPETLRVKQAVRELELDGLPLTIPNLFAKGLSPDILTRILIITFPPGEKAWNYFVPTQRWGCEKCGTPPDW